MIKKIAILTAALIIAIPAFAGNQVTTPSTARTLMPNVAR
jgi:hypothetical protein